MKIAKLEAYTVVVKGNSIIEVRDENDFPIKFLSLADVVFEAVEKAGFDCQGTGLGFER